MKKTNLLFASAIVLSLMSCKKDIYGCKDPTAVNFSDYATKDDGSCYHVNNIESDEVTVTNWGYTNPYYYATINYPAITQEVVDHGAVLVYIKTGNGQYSQLPLTFYPSASWSTSVEVVHSLNQVDLFWTDSDLNTAAPGSWTFKIVVIQDKSNFNPKDLQKELMSL